MPSVQMPLLLTKRAAAEALSLSESEVDRLRRAGRLLAKKCGNRVLFPVSELEKFVESLPGELDQ